VDPVYLNLRTKEDYIPYRSLLPKATGTKSWKKLCAAGVSYSIIQTNLCYLINKTSLDRSGRWIYTKENSKSYPLETKIHTILNELLLDYSKKQKQVFTK
jgi:hypothetical protein